MRLAWKRNWRGKGKEHSGMFNLHLLDILSGEMDLFTDAAAILNKLAFVPAHPSLHPIILRVQCSCRISKRSVIDFFQMWTISVFHSDSCMSD